MSVRSIVERVRQPEYTGENRCIPCTAVNLVIAGVLGVVLAVVSIPAGIVAFAGSVGAISLRGYLVPGTPELTKRYFPDWLLARFDKLPENPGGGALAGVATGTASGRGGSTTNAPGGATTDRGAGDAATSRPGTTSRPDATDTDQQARDGSDSGDDEVADPEWTEPEVALREAGAIGPCEVHDDLCLADEFQAVWRDRITDLREGGVEASDALGALGVTDADAWVTEGETDGSLSRDGDAITLEQANATGIAAQWESEAALLADVAGAEVLADRFSAWDALGVEERSQLLYALRLFVETCPACDGRVTLGGEVVTSCCRSVEVAVVTCEDCGARLFEQQ